MGPRPIAIISFQSRLHNYMWHPLKEHLLNSPEKFTLFQHALFDHAKEFGWNLEAWAILSNHYHFVAQSPENADNLPRMLQSLHSKTAIDLNAIDNTEGRKVWYQYRDTCLSDQKSYLRDCTMCIIIRRIMVWLRWRSIMCGAR